VWKISDGDTKSLYAMNIMPPKDMGGIVHPQQLALLVESVGTWHYLLKSMWHALIFLTSMVNEHVFMGLVSLSQNFSPQ
jgi:hypothetical protein